MQYAVDAHQHLWNPATRRHTWLEVPELARINRPFDMTDYRSAVRDGVFGLPVGGSVLIQSLPDRAETIDLLAIAAADPLVAGVVGWADLHRTDLVDELDRLTRSPGGAHLRGIRHLVQDEIDDRWIARAETIHGLRTVATAGLTYDLLITPRQLTAALTVAEVVPELPLVIDHGAKPDLTLGHRTTEFEIWTHGIRRLASHPQVTVKVSGLVTQANWRTWRLADILPAFDVLIDAFGPNRLMFGSDWPVCLVAATWQRWARHVGDLLFELTPGQRSSILGGTAASVYGGPRLTLDTSTSTSEGNTP